MGNETRLPPLKALLALESVVRHRSVSHAADELCVTHGAVSKQLARLSDWIDAPLFSENRRGMVPTPAAVRLAAGVHDGLSAIRAALEEIGKTPADATTLDIVAPATFAIYWLLPRLPELRRTVPDLRTHVRYTHTGDSWQDLPFDLAIRLGRAAPAEGTETPLFQDTLGLLAAPSLARTVRHAGDLAAIPFLESETRPGELDGWLAAAGLARANVRAVERFEHNYVAIEAALAGQGAVVAPLQLLARHRARGALALTLPSIRVPGPHFVAVHDPNAPKARAAAQCIAWLVTLGLSAEYAAASKDREGVPA